MLFRSFTKADGLTQVANIVYEAPFKLLIPQEFGGGFIKDRYQGYGQLGHKKSGEPQYDIFELLAFWNKEQPLSKDCARLASLPGKAVQARGSICDWLKFDGTGIPPMKEMDRYTDFNRSLGIGLFHDKNITLRYPLKLVSASYKGTYEECQGISASDPNQGLTRLMRPTVRRRTVRGHWPF